MDKKLNFYEILSFNLAKIGSLLSCLQEQPDIIEINFNDELAFLEYQVSLWFSFIDTNLNDPELKEQLKIIPFETANSRESFLILEEIFQELELGDFEFSTETVKLIDQTESTIRNLINIVDSYHFD